jgi:hypothetical protein
VVDYGRTLTSFCTESRIGSVSLHHFGTIRHASKRSLHYPHSLTGIEQKLGKWPPYLTRAK